MSHDAVGHLGGSVEHVFVSFYERVEICAVHLFRNEFVFGMFERGLIIGELTIGGCAISRLAYIRIKYVRLFRRYGAATKNKTAMLSASGMLKN